jgi:hypothetical protein
VEPDRGDAVRVADGLPIELVAVADVEHAVVVRLDLGMAVGHGARP